MITSAGARKREGGRVTGHSSLQSLPWSLRRCEVLQSAAPLKGGAMGRDTPLTCGGQAGWRHARCTPRKRRSGGLAPCAGMHPSHVEARGGGVVVGRAGNAPSRATVAAPRVLRARPRERTFMDAARRRARKAHQGPAPITAPFTAIQSLTPTGSHTDRSQAQHRCRNRRQNCGRLEPGVLCSPDAGARAAMLPLK